MPVHQNNTVSEVKIKMFQCILHSSIKASETGRGDFTLENLSIINGYKMHNLKKFPLHFSLT